MEARAPDGRQYFFHLFTREVRWDRPVEEPLPAGWVACFPPGGQVHGSWSFLTVQMFYVNTVTNETSFTFPTAPAIAPVAEKKKTIAAK